VRRATGRAVTATIVGSFDPAGPLAGLAGADGVGLLGYVADLAPLYARASAAVVPLRWGSGTSIKLLEAFAHRVPVVATPVAARGLAVVDRIHLLVAEQPSELAERVVELVAHPEYGRDLAEEARTLVERRYSRSAVAPIIGAFLAERT
jgi:glycosyltransferase involved in cell wall biosynthesis